MDLVREQHTNNLAAECSWDLYEPHRSRVTSLLRALNSSTDATLCLLGGGNLNDVDVRELLLSYSHVTVIDLDRDAVEAGLARQELANDPRVRILAPVDLTGMLMQLSFMPTDHPGKADALQACLAMAEKSPTCLDGLQFDVVASVGLLTQLICTAVNSIGEGHPRFWDLASALRAQHMRLILGLARNGGKGVVVTEVLSSDTCPDLSNTPDSELGRLLSIEMSAQNFFTGTNPAAIARLLKDDPKLSGLIHRFALTEPWLWQFTARVYAVYAIVMMRRDVTADLKAPKTI